MEQRIRTVLLLWLFLSAVSSLQSQSAGDIDTISEWRVNFINWGSMEGDFDFYKYFISGDTIVGSQEYLTVYKSGYWYSNFGGPPYVYHYYSDVYAGALREEGNKWYSLDGDTDVLLYDFTMSVGDTVYSYANQYGGIITVDSINLIEIDGELKKRFYVNCFFGAEYIIEDIGATTGIWEELNFELWESELVCYAKDGVSLWGASTEECDLAVSITEYYTDVKISAYPNPFTTSTTIEHELTEPSLVQISIYNALGEVVYKSDEVIISQGKHTFVWSPDRLPEGMYYGVLRSGGWVSVIKMIKQ